jgi:hypothetical protein
MKGELEKELFEAIKKYSPKDAKEIIWDVRDVLEYTKSLEAVNSVAQTIKRYSDSPEDAKEIAWRFKEIAWHTRSGEAVTSVAQVIGEASHSSKLAKADAYTFEKIASSLEDAGHTRSAEAVESAAKVSGKYYSYLPEVGIEIRDDIGEVAWHTRSPEAVKKFCKLLEDREIGEFIYTTDLGIDEIIKIIKYYDLVEKEKVEGIRKAVIGGILNIDPEIDNFYEEVKERTKNKFGIDLSELTHQELCYTILSFKNLYEGYRFGFKKLLELLTSEKYWEDKEIVKILEKMKKFNINVENLKGKSWIYKGDGKDDGNYLVGYYGKYIVNLYSNRSTLCHNFLPAGYAMGHVSILYSLDPRVLLIGYTFVEEFDKDNPMKAVRKRGEMDGVVISYIGLYDNKPILIVDSVEGGRAFRNYLDKNFRVIKGDIERVAKEIGVNYIIYNLETGAKCIVYYLEPVIKTPKYFNEKLRESGEKETIINTEIIGSETIPHDYSGYDEHDLEAFGGLRKPKGKVRGILYKIGS